MCGLTGFLDTSREMGTDALHATAARMADSLHHRGPDDAGVWADANAGIAFGFRRLAIVDLSREGHQPMRSASGRYVAVFNGEIYNYRALRRDVETSAAGPLLPFRGHSDTEVLLAAIERWGVESAVQRCIGMFAIAVWDRQERTLYLVRDRLGEKPLYYGWMGKTFLFGSELKALRAHPNFKPDINRDALVPFLRHKYIPSSMSIYNGISKLSPAAILTLRADCHTPGLTPRPTSYWSAREMAEAGVAQPFEGSEADATDQLDRLLREAIGLQMVADVPLGALLSGGIDSSSVVALMQAQSERPVSTFSIGFHEDGYNEAEHAKAVARHLGTDHTELYVTPAETLSVIPKLPSLYDEPFADVSQVPTYLVSEMARRHVTVSLSGDGGDELFAGYDRYVAGDKIWRRIGRAPRGMRIAAGKGLTALSPDRWDRALQRSDAVLPSRFRYRASGEKIHKLAGVLAVDSLEGMYHHLVSDWHDAQSVVVSAADPITLLRDRGQWAQLADSQQRMMYLDLLTYLPDDILTKVDRASMGVSLEVRAPFLDHRVVEFAWQAPMSMKVRQGQGKWLLRQVLDRYVPRDLIDRPKMGFTVPIQAWLRDPLREWAEGLLCERRLREEGFFDPAPIRQKWREHLSGKRSWSYLLWDVLMFQAWLEAQRTVGSHSRE